MSSVKLGPKGQIVIPKELRDMFGLRPGDSLIIMGAVDKGIALHKMSVFSDIADAILDGRAGEIYPGQPEEQSRGFAEAIKDVEEREE